jgi:hypothetical protein
MNEELQGTYVLIHPDLPDDPHKQEGQIGMIAYADLERDDFMISFEDGKHGLYTRDALLVLKMPDEVYKNVLTHQRELDASDFKTLLKINLYQQSATPFELKNALELARISPLCPRNLNVRRSSPAK